MASPINQSVYQFDEDSAHASGDRGTAVLVVRRDTAGSLADTNNDYTMLQVDANGNLRVVTPAAAIRHWYGGRISSGVLTAAHGQGAPFFAMRNAASPARLVYITRIFISFSIVDTYTAAQQFGLYIERFSGANMTGGVDNLANILRHDATSPASVLQDFRRSDTASLGTAGVTFASQFYPILGWTGITAGNHVPGYVHDFAENPIILASGEGITIANLIGWPATGTGTIAGHITWYES